MAHEQALLGVCTVPIVDKIGIEIRRGGGVILHGGVSHCIRYKCAPVFFRYMSRFVRVRRP